MSIDDRIRWDAKHRDAASLKPRASVVSLPRPARSDALALDVGCGQGRHARVLRGKGYRVVAMDVSRVALQHLRTRDRDGGILLLQADVDCWPLSQGCFDAVVQVDFLDRSLLPLLASSLAAGGLLLIDTFLDAGRPNAEGPRRSEFLLQPGELATAFPDLETLRVEEIAGATARAMLLARRKA